jgi:hypothetical protein
MPSWLLEPRSLWGTGTRGRVLRARRVFKKISDWQAVASAAIF